MIILAVGALVFLLALAVGTSDAMIRNSTGLYAGHIIGSDIAQADVQQLKLPSTKHILVRQHQAVLLRSNKGIEPVDLIGVNPTQEKLAAAYWKKTVKGSFLGDNVETIFLSQAILKRLKVSLGDNISLVDRHGTYLKKLKVGGAYKTGISYLDQGVAFCSTQAMPPGDRQVTIATFLKADASPEIVADQYRRMLPSATFKTWHEFMPDLKQLIDLNDFCMNILIFLVFAIVAVGVSCTFLIFTLKNLREHGIMKAMGFMARETTLLLLTQIGLLTLCAATIGTVLGALIAWAFSNGGIDISTYISHNQYFAVSGVLYPRLTGLSLFAPPLVAVTFSLIAAVWPIAYVLRKNPAEILRSV